jgi:iron complex transport system substrate-binding protein
MGSRPAPTISRRGLLLAAGAVVIAAGCNDDDSTDRAASTTTGAAGRSAPEGSTSDVGGVIDPTGVIVLDEIAALSVLSLGIVPKALDATFGYTTVMSICESLGVVVNPGGRSVEAVLADGPSAVVGVSIPTFVEATEQYNEVAAIVVDFAATWQQQLNQIASALGAEGAAAALTTRIDQAIARLRDDLDSAGRAGQTVSVIAGSADGPFALSRTGLVGQLLGEVGLGRPAAQDVDTVSTAPFIDISDEVLASHDADVIIRLAGPSYPTSSLESSPLWSTLTAVGAGEVYDVTAEMWFAASAFSLDWIIDDLRAVLLGDGVVAGGDDAVTRFTAFSAEA